MGWRDKQRRRPRHAEHEEARARIAAFLKVESVPGAGTMILLRLPLDPSPGPTTRAMQLSLDTEAVIEQLKQS